MSDWRAQVETQKLREQNEPKTSWRELIEVERAEQGDGPIIHSTMTDTELDKKFYDGFGGTRGSAFTAWSEKRVYFPATWDGSEWVASVPRHPCDEITGHVGGE